MKHPIFFLRGLNTRGDDNLRIGPFSLGRMQRRIEKAFHKNEVSLLSVDNMGSGTLEEQTQRSIDFIENKGLKRFHVLGHSTGGLIARMISHHKNVSEKIISIVTVASPHHGSHLANQAIAYNKSHPLMYRACKHMGYDISEKLHIFESVKPESMVRFNKTFPHLNHSASIICQIPLRKQSFPFKIFHKALKTYENELHDGLLEGSSQRWGNEIGEYELDHLSQIGFHFYLSPTIRKNKEDQFQKMIQSALQFMRLSESSQRENS